MMANLVPANAQGELHGATASVMSLTMIISPVFMTELFYGFSREGGNHRLSWRTLPGGLPTRSSRYGAFRAGRPMTLECQDLEQVFSERFFVDYHTVLVGGGVEPLYLPSDDASNRPHRVICREDFFASALHEVAHWCLAGLERRTREDYGYWYSPDGRDRQGQEAFEAVEARPQTLEWIFSDACDFSFHLSADNLTVGFESSERFEAEVEAQKNRLLDRGLSARAALYRRSLEQRLIGSRKRPPGLLPTGPANRLA
jgi:elongation factor P hydroxylase